MARISQNALLVKESPMKKALIAIALLSCVVIWSPLWGVANAQTPWKVWGLGEGRVSPFELFGDMQMLTIFRIPHDEGPTKLAFVQYFPMTVKCRAIGQQMANERAAAEITPDCHSMACIAAVYIAICTHITAGNGGVGVPLR
jgi:hypothetical protein